jgi:uncharacterized membrane protein
LLAERLPLSAVASPDRSRTLQGAMIALALVGLGIAAYLTVVHYAGASPICASSHGCETVQHSRYAELAGIPVAVLGLAGYAAILATLAVPGERAGLAAVGLTITGLGFSAYLTYRELFTIHAICQWCVASAIVITALTALAPIRYLRSP